MIITGHLILFLMIPDTPGALAQVSAMTITHTTNLFRIMYVLLGEVKIIQEII